MAAKRRKLRKIERLLVWNMTEGHCAKCQADLPFLSEWHADHIVPFKKTGRTTLTDLQPLCADCNLTKGAKEDELSI
jgi:5-methylcytosine-specific restriction endonuclease McrA